MNTNQQKNMKILGLMSGTSLDGLDMALCNFSYQEDKQIAYQIIEAQTIPYDKGWRSRLAGAHLLSAYELSLLDAEYGIWCGQAAADFIEQNGSVDYIASHGHTVFHRPELGFTKQIGRGEHIAVRSGIPTWHDFRSLDVALGGQGAPLVPIGDELLFSEYAYCLNIGGIANVSFNENNRRLAFDISPANLIFNALASKLGFDFDRSGEIGRAGKLIPELLDALNNLDYYRQPAPKSLGREWLDENIWPLLESYSNIADILNTCYVHVGQQIGKILNSNPSRTLVTGGGAYNTFLLEQIQTYSVSELVVPEDKLVQFKEALIFAFLAFLRNNGQVNALKSVTGARKNSSGGILSSPFSNK